jgi:hypothetical protein
MLHGKTWIGKAVILLQRLEWMPAFRHCHLSAMSIRAAYYSCCCSSLVVKFGKDAGIEIEPYFHLSNTLTSGSSACFFSIGTPS